MLPCQHKKSKQVPARMLRILVLQSKTMARMRRSYIEGLSAEPASAVYKPCPMSKVRGFTTRLGKI